MEEITRETSKRGATMMNIIPLIPAHNFADKCPPMCKEVADARAKANKYLAQFRVCKQCTADVKGIPGFEREDIKTFCDSQPVGNLGTPNSGLTRLFNAIY
jgi:nitrogen fixation protein NifB